MCKIDSTFKKNLNIWYYFRNLRFKILRFYTLTARLARKSMHFKARNNPQDRTRSQKEDVKLGWILFPFYNSVKNQYKRKGNDMVSQRKCK